MADFNTSKVDGNTVAAAEWNQFVDIDNAITTSGQTPSSGNTNQLGIAAARYSSGGQFYTDSGTANAYVLTPISPFQAPVSATITYFNGMVIRFRAGNSNTGASTVNINGAGVVNLKQRDGTTDLARGDISSSKDSFFRYNGTSFIQVNQPSITIQKFTSGSSTYTTPAAVNFLRVRAVGGGGGGGGSGTGGGTGGTGGNTTFGTSLIVANGGIGGSTNGALGGAGGTASLGTAVGTALAGGYGQAGITTSVASTNPCGGYGAASAFGGAGSGANGSSGGAGGAGIANTGGGGGGAGCTATGTFAGAGGGAGGFVDAYILNPSATYSYAVGAAGAGGTAGTSGFVGGAGGSGYIEITEFYY